MSLIVNGTTLPSDAVITCNGVTLSSIVCNAVEVWKKGTLTLKEVVFNASGTFTVPSDAINNTFYVGCTGGGGQGSTDSDGAGIGGGGSGRTSTTITLSGGSQVAVIVGAGGYTNYGRGVNGGTSSFGGYLSCSGGLSSDIGVPSGVSGGGSGGYNGGSGGASNCPALFSITAGAVDNTNKLYTAKSYAGGAGYRAGTGSGAGCYGNGVAWSASGGANTGAGGSGYRDSRGMSGGSGKVVIYYYAYV